MRKYLLILTVILFANQLFSQVVFGKINKKTEDKFSINYSSPKEYEIAEIAVAGVEFLDNNALISLSGLRVGDKISIPGDEISLAIKKLWKQGIIGSISIYASKVEETKIWLTIELKERARLTRYIIEGVSKTHEGEIKKNIELVRGKVLTNVILKNAEISIKKYLEGKGFLNAKIMLTQQKDTILKNSVYLKIDINKGEKVKIKDINFIGNTTFSDKKLRKKLKKTGASLRLKIVSELLRQTKRILVSPKRIKTFLTSSKKTPKDQFTDYLSKYFNLNFFKNSKYVKGDYKEDKQLLVDFFNSKGYRDALIISDSIYAVNNKYINIDIRIYQGKKYYFGNIDWTGNFVYSDRQLDAVLGVKKGDIYDLELVNKKLNFNPAGADISSLYLDDGYLFFNISPHEIKIAEDSIDVEMRIFEGTQATIDEVTISGNSKTNDHVILRELRTVPGDKFSRAQLIRTQRELSQLGYFDPEQINPVPIPDPISETVDIEWQLVERSNDEIQLSGGWGGGNFGFVGTLGVSFNNFSARNITDFSKWRGLPVGDGQRLSVRLQANGRSYQSYSFSFSEPWLGGKKRNAFGISYNYSIQRSINRTTNATLGFLKVTGVSLSLGRQAKWPDDFFTISNSILYQKYDLNRFGTRSLGFETGISNSFIFNTTIARNSVDNPTYPRSGTSISLSASFTPPYSMWRNIDYENAEKSVIYKWLEYHKWNFDSRYYLTVVGKLVFASRAHFGYIGAYDQNVGVGPFERFQLGGDGLTGQNFLLGTDVIGLRGYTNNSITPIDEVDNIEGGTIFTKYVTELRYPVSLAPTATIYGLIFFEGGNNWNDFADFNPYNIKKSAGFGLRVLMPAFGLLGIDWGYGFDNAPGSLNQSGANFHFSIGQQIR